MSPSTKPEPALSVAEAQRRILADARPTAGIELPIAEAHGHTIASALAARLTQPPFDASAMDGYAVRSNDIASLPARLIVIGEAAAGHPFGKTVVAGQAVRIFTGAPLPDGADAVVIQENTRREGDRVEILHDGGSTNVRKRGFDFTAGQVLLEAGRRLGPRELGLAAAMGFGTVTVHRPPRVAILATGDELVEPGVIPGPGQIVCSNHLAIAAMVRAVGGDPMLLGIARDTRASLSDAIDRADGADVLVTIGGASVGDHDLVAPVLKDRGIDLAFWKIAMRPGKPLMFGRLGAMPVLGLPGNPVSAIVCARLFLMPLLTRLLGRPEHITPLSAITTEPLEENGPRAHYMRATIVRDGDGRPRVTPVPSQDSSLLSPLARADAFIVRPAGAEACPAGTLVEILPIDF